MALVRDLRQRCSWDRVQTRETLRPYLVEEVLELDRAIAEADRDAMPDELGDILLLQVGPAGGLRTGGDERQTDGGGETVDAALIHLRYPSMNLDGRPLRGGGEHEPPTLPASAKLPVLVYERSGSRPRKLNQTRSDGRALSASPKTVKYVAEYADNLSA